MSSMRVKERSESLEATAQEDEMELEQMEGEEEEQGMARSNPSIPEPAKRGSKKKKQIDTESEGYDSESERLFSNHLLHIVSALGGRDVVENKYVPGDEAIDCIRDLKRFLRMDEEENNEDKPAQNLLAKWNILSTDLLPLLVVSVESSNWKLAILTCEILVPLTWPVNDPTKIRDLDRVRTYKPAFLKPGVWSAIIRVILHLSSTPYSRRSENDHARLHLIISLIRNVLAIGDFHDSSVHASNQSYLSATCQEELIARMMQEDVVELLLSLAASTNEFEYRPWNTVLLEIFYYIFQYRTVSDLLVPNVNKQKSALQDMMAKEALKRKPHQSRHARFGGTFSLKTSQGQVNVRSVDKFKNVGSHEVSISKAFDSGKRAKSDGRNKPIDIFTEKLLVMGSSRKIFRKVADGFLENCFTNLLTSVKKDFELDRKGLVEADYLHFFSIYSFFLEFHLATHENEDDLDNVTGMINHQMTIFILKRAAIYRDEKNYKALYFTAKSLQYYLGVLKRMDKCVDEGMRQASLSVQSQFFYETAHISCVLNLARDSKPRYWRFLVTVADCIYTMGELMKANFGEKGVAVTNKRVGVAESDEEDFPLYERIYTTDTFYKQCAYESVIDTYCYLLQHFEYLPDQTVTHIAELFEIISRTDTGCNLAPLFYTASTFHTFHYFLNSPVSRSPVYEPLKNVIHFICSEAITRVTENPYIVIDFLFSKTRSDCNRLLGNEDFSKGITLFEEEPEDDMTEDDLEKEFGLLEADEEIRGEKIRKLSKWISRRSTENADCIRWLASSMRIVLYEDFDDMLEDDPSLDRHTATLSQFIYMPSAPYFVNEFLMSKPAILLLNLLRFIPVVSEDTYRFPSDLNIDLIEHVERAKLFTKRYIPPPKKVRQSKIPEKAGDQESEEEAENQDTSDENESQVKTKKKKKNSIKRRSVDSPKKSSRNPRKEKEGLRIKSAQFVLDSSDDENDEAFFKAEAALRAKRDLLARQGILTNGVEAQRSPTKKKGKQLKLQSVLDSEDTKSEDGNETEIFRAGIEVEQESHADEWQDQEVLENEISSQQKLINQIMGGTKFNFDSEEEDIENHSANIEQTKSSKKIEQITKGTTKDLPAIEPLKKRARVILDSDSD